MRIQILLAGLFLSTAALAAVTNAPITGQRFAGDVVVAAPPKAVFAALTDVAKLSQIMRAEAKTKGKLTKVGDSAKMSAMGDTGTLVVTTYVKDTELRLQFDPDNGTYLCQDRITLTADGAGTKVVWEQRYTESGPQKPEDLQAQVKALDEGLAALAAMFATKAK